MSTYFENYASTSTFLLAHQDDEFGCFFEIERKLTVGNEVLVIYLTSGTPNGAISERRNLESLNVLINLGVKKENIYFLGGGIGIPDGRLSQHLSFVYNEIIKILSSVKRVDSFYMPAWEGGHQDHDATYVLGVALAKASDVVGASYQFPLYTGFGLGSIFFRVFNALKANGRPAVFRIDWNKRVKYLLYCLSFPSQAKTWIGLFPFVLCHYLTRGTQIIQPISLSRIRERPHPEKLFYERRSFYEYEDFRRDISTFVKDNLHYEVNAKNNSGACSLLTIT